MFLVSIILALIGGALAGGGMLLADRVGFYLIVLVPVIAGAIIGFFAALPYFNRRPAAVAAPGIGGGLADVVVRDNRPGRMGLIIACVLGTIAASVVYWAGSYILGTQDFVDAIIAEDSSFTRDEAAQLIELYYADEYNSSGFIGFVQEMAALGISINRATSSSSGGINLQGNLVYAYWVIEILLMLGLSISTALRRARGEAPVPQPATA